VGDVSSVDREPHGGNAPGLGRSTVPAAKPAGAVMLTVIASGVTQQPLPAGETCSQAPPVAVDEATEKSKFELLIGRLSKTVRSIFLTTD